MHDYFHKCNIKVEYIKMNYIMKLITRPSSSVTDRDVHELRSLNCSLVHSCFEISSYYHCQ